MTAAREPVTDGTTGFGHPDPAANRDPGFSDDADRFVIDRAEPRHAASGPGIHRCPGSNLAGREQRVAIEELVAHVEPAGEIRCSVGPTRGSRELPVRVRT